MALDRKLLGIYLNDHLAGSTAGRELAARARGSNKGTELGRFLDGLVREIDEDRRTVETIMQRLGIGKDHLKVYAGWATEKVGRLKLNGSLWSYSPLSRVVELEGLSIGVAGKIALWRSLELVAEEEPELEGIDFAALIERGERQRAEVEEWRLRAVADALGAGATK